MLRPEIRPEGPSLIYILFGMLKIMHLKQFVTIFLSINILLLIFRIISLKTFLIILIVCGISLIILTWIDYIIKKRRTQHNELVPLLQQESNWGERTTQVRYDLKLFNRSESPDEPGICGVCLQKIPEGTEVAVLPCMHSFHPKCIERWTKVQNECPMCKATII
ncbi:hypothetical protein TRFO_14511 [Tritrichomonas foetus]|uniref:RING-type domain-containing protein n=1 Tax=Tritrichomonas foetus TaxID=1144522 RepID=A0A1J4KUR8_9EUKA|nr:hypothetical protein TRFO_14511 [Tritrichomonas foetus]|eukprot:OHT15019.1 hypothetical protein TRFO_14511 [Tritrichomonas foetus]